MSTELPKAYEPKEAQQKWLAHWEERGYFRSSPDPKRKPYTIVIPPPNVTGALHLGHALNNTLQDILIRRKRMQGFNALWIPGTDHAGIATQAVVEKLVMQSEKKTRHDLGRDELVKRIWQWKDKYEKRILGQLKELGSSCDWSRTRFTLDEMCARAVYETFFRMFKDGYIFRGKRLVNWDTQLQTSVADDETYTEDVNGGFWTFKYPVVGMPDTFIRFSTTRPETMLGDTAVCVHPNDERYKHLIGKKVLQPLVNREIPIIADGQLADPELGTGCVKVTPAHDPNDYACWTRNPQIGMINILNPDGTINSNGGTFAGHDRYKARDEVTKAMEELGLFEGKEDRVIPMKFSDRSKTPIEPLLSDQWFVKMGDRDDGKPGLAQMAMDAVTSDNVKIFPERYANSYLDWLGEKRDWCISRQLWWGHRIPVWSKQETIAGSDFLDCAALSELPQEKRGYTGYQAHQSDDKITRHICIEPGHTDIEKHFEERGYLRDPDVLDTWFSSALWPHSTLGWPEQTPELKYYYPTSVLVTSRDIITLWVARMVLTGLYNVGEIPFHHVYIHPKVLDGFGETMNKTKGNGIDPLDIIDLYGADALRYGMASLATENQDSRLPVVNLCPFCSEQVAVKQEHMYMRTKKLTCPKCKKQFRPGGPWPEDDPELPTAKQGSDRFEQGRNFANKLWNAARFLLMNLEGYAPTPVDLAKLPTEDRWITSRLATVTREVDNAFESYRFAEAARLIYEFTWTEFCDWYIEMSKGRLKNPDSRPLAQTVLIGVLDGILRLVHPVMPFLSESLWHALNEAAPNRGIPTPRIAEESVCIAKWPAYPEGLADARVEMSIARMQDLVRGIREVRNRYQVDSKTQVSVTVKCSEEIARELNDLRAFTMSLGGVGSFECSPNATKPKQAGTIVRPEFEAYVSLEGLIDPAAEIKRLEKQIADLKKQSAGMSAKLGNESYVKNAPAEVVEETRKKVAEMDSQLKILENNIEELRQA